MPLETHSRVHATQAWLLSTRHVQVPFAWLQACVEWLQEEAGGANRLSQQQINQQVLDQWLLTDLRDLDHPVLPEGLAQAQKTELRGFFCVQVDSLLDISQPAYGQLQKWRGTDCSNDEVSAVTQRPWEAKPNRMLLLQVTDGVQSLEAMEYQSIPALSSALRPGAKLQLQGQMVSRLGVLLLGPSNVKVLGGEVEDLAERNNQGKVLCRTLGLPEEEQQQQQQEEERVAEVPVAQQQGNWEMEDLEVDDEELLASLEQGEADVLQVGPARDSGYETLQETSTPSSRSSFARSLLPSRSEISTPSHRSGSIQSNRVQVPPSSVQQDSDAIHQSSQEDNLAGDEFPDGDFDDLPLDELDSIIFQENIASSKDSGHRNTSFSNTGGLKGVSQPKTAPFEPLASSGSGTFEGSSVRSATQKRDHQGHFREASHPPRPFESSAASEQSHQLQLNDVSSYMDEDMDCLFQEIKDGNGGNTPLCVQEEPRRDKESITGISGSSTEMMSSTPPGVTLTSSPFTYLCLLEDLMSKPHPQTIEIHIKAFIVTLRGKLSSSNGVWSISATISDGTGYLDVELSNQVLTDLLGFSVAEKMTLKRDPARRGELDCGMRRCQEQLVDMCCIMTIVMEPENGRAVVAKAEPVSERVFQELEHRRRK
uniref:RecQ-mediated genome instability protein 1 n=3 Tax=Nothobranchius korthausae TaxID=1143690 RepID=A0A1A8FSL5_9TELE